MPFTKIPKAVKLFDDTTSSLNNAVARFSKRDHFLIESLVLGAIWCVSLSKGDFTRCFWYHWRASSKVKVHHSSELGVRSAIRGAKSKSQSEKSIGADSPFHSANFGRSTRVALSPGLGLDL